MASGAPKYVDPGLSGLVQELEPTFRYASDGLLDQNSISLGLKETATSRLPGNTVLQITPMGITVNRVRLRLTTHKKRGQVFETLIHLLNLGSITAGRTKHLEADALCNIFFGFEFFPKNGV